MGRIKTKKYALPPKLNERYLIKKNEEEQKKIVPNVNDPDLAGKLEYRPEVGTETASHYQAQQKSTTYDPSVERPSPFPPLHPHHNSPQNSANTKQEAAPSNYQMQTNQPASAEGEAALQPQSVDTNMPESQGTNMMPTIAGVAYGHEAEQVASNEPSHGQTSNNENTSTSSSQAGWYADPAGKFQYRYFDGQCWTDHVATDGVTYSDPVSQYY